MIILSLGNAEAWKTVWEYIRSRKTRVTCLSDKCKQASKYRNKVDKKDKLWVTVGTSRVERNVLNVHILR